MQEKSEKKTIISADDFGISQRATRNILDLVSKKRIDRVEIMMSQNITLTEARTLLDSGVKLDIHFHLLGDKLDHWQNEPRVIDTGIIKRVVLFIFNYLLGKGTPSKAEKEWERQIKEFVNIFGKCPDGVSSHEHIHFFTSYFKIIVKLSKKYDIPYLRMGRHSVADIEKKCKIAMVLGWLRKKNKDNLQDSKLDTSDYMVSFDWLRDFNGLLEKIPSNKQVEIVFHPELKPEYDVLNSL